MQEELGPAMPMTHAVVDLAWEPAAAARGEAAEDALVRFRVIELNPWGSCSGGALFSWADDRAVLHGDAPFECRIQPPP